MTKNEGTRARLEVIYFYWPLFTEATFVSPSENTKKIATAPGG
ncbi:hypothetical protein GWI33_010278, partial [Rhynchophorus ferrugineus]